MSKDFDQQGRFFSAFPAFRHKNYRLYFAGQFVSLIGTWLQIVALGWLVLQLTNSAFLVGVASALAALPVLIFSLVGGVIVDRFSTKNILIFTQGISMFLAFVLGFLTVFHKITVSEIFVIAFISGVVSALDGPARQSFVIELVDKKDLASAIALNSGTFNGARVIGPAFAGFLIGLIGTGGAFIINGVSFLAVIFALLFIRIQPVVQRVHLHPLKAIREGISYSFSHPIIKNLLIFAAVSSIFGWSYSTIMPVIAKNIFHKNAVGLGYLYSASGVGALIAAFIISIFSKKVNPMTFIFGGSILFSLSIILFSLTSNFLLALILLFFSGVGLMAQFTTMNTSIQHAVPDAIRGRVMSIYMLMFLGMFPIGSFQVGFLAEHFGSQLAVRVGAFVILLFSVGLYLNEKKQRFAS